MNADEIGTASLARDRDGKVVVVFNPPTTRAVLVSRELFTQMVEQINRLKELEDARAE